MERKDRFLFCIAGEPRIGKTVLALNIAKKYVSDQKRSVVIFDPTGCDQSYSQFKKIDLPTLSNIHLFKEKNIFTVFDPDYKKIFEYGKFAKDILLILDDTTAYMHQNLQKPIESYFSVRHHYKQDIILICHALSGFPPKAVTKCNGVFIFKTQENTEKLKSLNRIPQFEKIQLAVNKLQVLPNPKHQYEFIQF